ncbi:hypothetical protein HH219_16675 [Pseudoalteromonas sp. NEC-BIFX-2020_015]|uniref:hypothetical protein n=1 Tax=Pseudoalteromonas sp. NEC-BIFX-2020_015 TaxID=2729544 RepID=UPI0014613A27|nr:hypothetical protein [Pseudoalteromonas sp. NEC-BIFX-2020_015]NMR27146.1 hypothetical protein [Pseudoalteromonas sp. NEC-BIFX-2020_015]
MKNKGLLALCLYITPLYTNAAQTHHQGFVKGQAVTGFNRYLSEPLWNLGQPFDTAGFNFLFEHTPNTHEPAPLTYTTSWKTLVATGVDNNYLSTLSISINDVNYEHINLPLREVFYSIGSEYGRKPLESIFIADIDEISKAAYHSPITLELWLSAKGNAKYKCNANNQARISFQLNGLIPNGVYTAWGVFSQDNSGNGVADGLAAIPLGGLPNVVVANNKGKATFKRSLNFCPSRNEQLLVVEFDYHSDGNVYGGIPDNPREGFPSGIVTHSHLAFPFNVQAIE